SVLAVANLPGHEWLLRGALLWQDPAAAAAVTWPVPQQKPAPEATSAPEPVTATEEASAAVQEPQGAATPAPAATPEPTATPLPSAAPDIENPGSIRAEQFGQGSGDGYITLN